MGFKTISFMLAIIATVVLVECYPATNGNDPQLVCNLPPLKGLCRALIPRWTYDVSAEKCVEFKFGGCAGNANNFPTEKDCVATCGGIKKVL